MRELTDWHAITTMQWVIFLHKWKFPEYSYSFSRIFPNLGIPDPNNITIHVSGISHKVYVCTCFSWIFPDLEIPDPNNLIIHVSSILHKVYVCTWASGL